MQKTGVLFKRVVERSLTRPELASVAGVVVVWGFFAIVAGG